MLFFILLMALLYIISVNNLKSENAISEQQLSKIRIASGINIDFNKYRYIFIVDFLDFNCPSCFNDFIFLSDCLNYNKEINDSVLYLIVRDDKTIETQNKMVNRWRKNNYIKYPVLIAENILEGAGLTKSCLLIKDKAEYDIIYFPINNKNENIIKMRRRICR